MRRFVRIAAACLVLTAALTGCTMQADDQPASTPDPIDPNAASACPAVDRALKPIAQAISNATKKTTFDVTEVQVFRTQAVISKTRLEQAATMVTGRLAEEITKAAATIQVFVDAIDDGIAANHLEITTPILQVAESLWPVKSTCAAAGHPIATTW